MRTIKELLQIMLNNQNYFSTGLCKWALMCHLNDLINLEEYLCLRDYILQNEPFIFYDFERFKQEVNREAYWWKEGNINPRIKWLNKHIKKNS